MNKFKPESPDPFLKKPEDMAPAKFGHLNELVKQINAGGGGGSLTLTTTGTGAATLVGNTLNIPTPAPLLTTSVTVTGAQMIASTSHTILAAPDSTKYYALHSVAVKFKGGTTPFDNGSPYNVSFGTGRGVAANSGNLSEGITVFNIPTNTTDAMLAFLSGVMFKGEALTFNLHAGSEPTVGDSDVVFDITYELKDF
jgi:hypothetical protein